MATKQGLASFQLADAVGVVKSFDMPFKFDDATATLAQILSWVSGLGVALDLVTDAKITKIRLTLLIPLPGGIKASAVSASDVEETGLITYAASGTSNAYGVDIPAIPNSKLTGNQVNLAETDVAAFTAYLNTPSNSIVGTDRYANAIVSATRGSKTFRKSRRALRRA